MQASARSTHVNCLSEHIHPLENFHFMLTRTLMLSLQVYFTVTSVETVSAELGEGLDS